MEDIETILNTLIYDGKVEMTIIAAKEGTVGSVDGQMKLYRAVNPILPPTGLVRAPCGLCPVSKSCFTVYFDHHHMQMPHKETTDTQLSHQQVSHEPFKLPQTLNEHIVKGQVLYYFLEH